MRRLAMIYCNCNDSTNVIIVIPKVNLLVSRNTKSGCTDPGYFGGFVFRENVCIFVVLCVGQILKNPLQKLHYLF